MYATPRSGTVGGRDLRAAIAALLAWVVVSAVGPTISSDPVTPLDGSVKSFVIVGIGAAAALVALAALRIRRPARPQPQGAGLTGDLALGDRTS